MAERTDFESVLKQLQEASLPDSVLYALSSLHGRELALLKGAWPSFSTECRQRIVSRLVEIGEADFETDFGPVFTACLEDEDPRVRSAAIDGLWEVEDVALIRPLIRMLREDRSEMVREAAAISLSRYARLAELEDLQPRLAEMVWDALWNAIHNGDEVVAVRRRAVESLAYYSRPEVAKIIETAYKDDEPMMRVSAVFAMGRTADEVWSGRVLAELDHDDPEMRYEAARASGALGLVEAIPMLSRMVADPDLEVKLASIWALGQIGGREAQRVLEICLEEGDEALRDAAEEALDELDYMQGTLDFPLYDYDTDDEDEDQEEDEEEDDWEDEDEIDWEDENDWDDKGDWED